MNELRWRSPDGKIDAPMALSFFASSSDYAICKRLHRKYGTTYYFAARRLPANLRRRVIALNGFVRVPADWIDNPKRAPAAKLEQLLNAYRNDFIRGMDGVIPGNPVLRAFCDVAHEVSLPIEEPLRFLDAMEQNIHTCRYETYDELRRYMRGSASSVGLMACMLMEVPPDQIVRHSAIALGEAMQLTKFLRDVGDDLRRGRVYIPMEDMRRFSGSEDAILQEEVNQAFARLMNYEIERARGLYAEADLGISLLPTPVLPAVKLARILYARILDRIEQRRYDVFSGRARTSSVEKLAAAVRVLTGAI